MSETLIAVKAGGSEAGTAAGVAAAPFEAATGAPLISLRGVSKVYRREDAAPGRAGALVEVDLDVRRGECVAIVGKSGSGKTTLINLITGIDTPSAGSIQVGPVAVHALRQAELAAWRGRSVGLVFQFFQLLPTLTVLENVVLPMDLCGCHPRTERKQRAAALLRQVGVGDQAHKLPAELSGGQQQRVAIARALANDPPLLVADEPTGNLDAHTSDQVLELFADFAAAGKTVLVVTHEREFGRFFNRVITLADGRVVQ